MKKNQTFGEFAELANIQNSLSDAMLVIDAMGKVIFYNSRFELMYLAVKGERLAQPGEIKLLGINEEVELAYAEVFKTGLPQSLAAIKFPRHDGGRLYVSVSLSPIKKGSEITGVVGVFHDVTELKTAEQMRIDFVANVSHELRTPLTSIQGYVETLIGDVDQGRPLETSYLKVIQRNTDRLIHLIDDLLDLSNLDSNMASLQKEKVDTAEITQRVLARLKKQYESKDHVVEIDSRRAPFVWADPGRLEQVLTNLIENAAKYSPPKTQINITWRDSTESPGVVLTVADSGPGISPKYHARLFERFFRVDKARSRDLGGTGLGLAIVKHIVQSHQGSVEVDSAPGKGSTFICLFPNPKNFIPL